MEPSRISGAPNFIDQQPCLKPFRDDPLYALEGAEPITLEDEIPFSEHDKVVTMNAPREGSGYVMGSLFELGFGVYIDFMKMGDFIPMAAIFTVTRA